MPGTFNLCDLENEKIDLIISLKEEQKISYIDNLIQKFYPTALEDIKLYDNLQTSYKSSFLVEKIYRNNITFQSGFSITYTNTGLIRNIISDLFFTDDDLIVH